MRALPSVQHQLAFNFRNTLFGHEDVNIGEGPPLGGREIRQKIGCAFQQDDSFIDAGQRAQDALDLPAHGGTLSIGHTQGGQEVRARPWRNAIHQLLFNDAMSEAGKQVCTPPLPNEEIPLRY